MFENVMKFLKNLGKKEKNKESSDTAKERLHLVLMQDRANVSADFLELMRQEIIEVIKKYIDIDEKAIDVRLTNKTNDDGTVGAPALYANIPIVTIKNEARIANVPNKDKKQAEKIEQTKQNSEEKKDEKNVNADKSDIAESGRKKEKTASTNAAGVVKEPLASDAVKEEKTNEIDTTEEVEKTNIKKDEEKTEKVNAAEITAEVIENDKQEVEQSKKILEEAEKIQNEIEKEVEEEAEREEKEEKGENKEEKKEKIEES